MKNSHITVTDQFCGAGGSSQGVRNFSKRAGSGVEVKLALNHWKLAIETHNSNFPDTLHDCTDVSACDPRRYPSTNILITSPECTTHSPAGGNTHKKLKETMSLFDQGKIDASTERSRATMWDVCRFAEYHRYEAIVVENVIEARTQWPLFEVWLQAMHTLGYIHQIKYINSQHCHPTPQSRDRMFVVFTKKGNKKPNLELTPKAYCPMCAKDVNAVQTWKNPAKKFGKYRFQYIFSCPVDGTQVEPYYYAAFNAIDWSDLGTRIGDRKRPLSENTMKRIQYGLDKYYGSPLVINTKFGKEARGVTRSVGREAFTQTTIDSHAIVNPLIIQTKQPSGISSRVKGTMDNPIGTQVTELSHALAIPMVIKGEHSSKEGYVKLATDPFQTQTVRQSMYMVNPFTNPNGIVGEDSWKSFIQYYYGTAQSSQITEPVDTLNTKDRAYLINYKKPEIEDCYYRMFYPHEVKAAMAFDQDYIILGTGKDQVKQCGNAVTPPVMEFLIERIVESLS